MKNLKPRISRMGADDPEKLVYRELSRSIVGAAMTVLNTLKPGLSEKAYENAMVIELQKRGHRTEQQRRFDVFYEGVWVDTLVPDLIVDDLVIVDPKVVTDFNDIHMAQDDRLSGHHQPRTRPVDQRGSVLSGNSLHAITLTLPRLSFNSMPPKAQSHNPIRFIREICGSNSQFPVP